jgi:hypothetical protein
MATIVYQPKYRVVRTDGTPIPEGEPVFVIRAQDAFALTTLRHYITATNGVVSFQMSQALEEHFIRILKWQEGSSGSKVPDL